MVLTALFLALLYTCTRSSAQTATDPIVVVGVETDSTSTYGTGFVVKYCDNYTTILTANHVVDETNIVQVKFNTMEERYGLVIRRDETKDLALILVAEAPRKKPMKFKTREVRELTRVYTIGHPVGLWFTHSQGRVQNVTREYNGVSHYQCDILANGGSSGSPLFVKTIWGRRVIGMVISYQASMPDISYSVQAKEIVEFLKKKSHGSSSVAH